MRSQCYCGNTYGGQGPAEEELCYMDCSWGEGICGGESYNSVFVAKEHESGFLGCFRDVKDSRDLVHVGSTSSSIGACREECFSKGHKYAGLQKGGSCYCGNGYGTHGEAPNCNTACKNGPGMCGGYLANSVYNTTGTVEGILGCYKDKPEHRDFSHEAGDSLSIQACKDYCLANGFRVAGLQNGGKCWCDNTYGFHGTADTCDVECANGPGMCGGFESNSVYLVSGGSPYATGELSEATADFVVDVPAVSTEDLLSVLNWIKAEVTILRNVFCWKGSYGRGVGTIPDTCPADLDTIGAFCYDKCPAKMARFGLGCRSVCPNGMRDDIDWCRKNEYGRGVGYITKGICESKEGGHGKCEQWGLFYYPKCRAEYSAFGCCVCRPNDRPDCSKLGLGRQLDLSCAKNTQSSGTHVKVFPSNKELQNTLCYTPCSAGYKPEGPVCWGQCSSSQVDCGAGCAATDASCALTVIDQVVAPLIVTANVASMGLATPATAGAAMTIKIAGKTVAGTSTVGKLFVKSVKALQSVNIIENGTTVVQKATVLQRVKHARTGSIMSTIKTFRSVATSTYQAQQEYREAFTQDFIAQTSERINRILDSKLHPMTAKYIKGVWADYQLMEMAQSNKWTVVENALSFASIVDITGIVGLVSAYAKPVCGENVPFPAIAAEI